MDARNQNRPGDVAGAWYQMPKFCFLLSLLGLLIMGVEGTWEPLVVYCGVSVLTFFLYSNDKSRALNNSWRIPEYQLHIAEFCGGWPGALLAQQEFHHKTSKVSYQQNFWMIVWLHQAFWIIVLLSHEH